MLFHRNPNYTPQEWRWYVVLALSGFGLLLFLSPLALWVGHYGALLPPGRLSTAPRVDQLGSLGAILLFPVAPLLALNYWLVFRSRSVQHLPVPVVSPGRYRLALGAFVVACFALFVFITSCDRLYPY
jgi:hypothetical protein